MIISSCQTSPQGHASKLGLSCYTPYKSIIHKCRRHGSNMCYNHVAATVPSPSILGQELHAQRLGFDILCPTFRAALPAFSIQHTATRTLRLGLVWAASEAAVTDTLPEQVGVFQELWGAVAAVDSRFRCSPNTLGTGYGMWDILLSVLYLNMLMLQAQKSSTLDTMARAQNTQSEAERKAKD